MKREFVLTVPPKHRVIGRQIVTTHSGLRADQDQINEVNRGRYLRAQSMQGDDPCQLYRVDGK